jgi:hypothetical protein
MKIFIMQFSRISYRFIPLWPKTSCSQTPSIYVRPLMSRDHVSLPYRTTGKIIVLYIVILIQNTEIRILYMAVNTTLYIFPRRLRALFSKVYTLHVSAFCLSHHQTLYIYIYTSSILMC